MPGWLASAGSHGCLTRWGHRRRAPALSHGGQRCSCTVVLPVIARRSRSAPEAMPSPTMRADRFTPVTVSAGPRTISLTELDSSRTATMVVSASTASWSIVSRRAADSPESWSRLAAARSSGCKCRRQLLAEHLQQPLTFIGCATRFPGQPDQGPGDGRHGDRDDHRRDRRDEPEHLLLHRPTVPQSDARSGMMLARLTTTRMATQDTTAAHARLKSPTVMGSPTLPPTAWPM